MMGLISKLSRWLLSICFAAVVFSVQLSPAFATENLINSSFEEDNLAGWQLGTVSDAVKQVGNESFTYPYQGEKMARLGTPAIAGQNPGPNELYQDFEVKDPNLRFAYNLFTYDIDGYDQFSYKLIDLTNNSEVVKYSQTAWGAKAGLKSTGWKTVSLDVSRYVGKKLRLILSAGGTGDTSLATWSYIDGLGPSTNDDKR